MDNGKSNLTKPVDPILRRKTEFRRRLADRAREGRGSTLPTEVQAAGRREAMNEKRADGTENGSPFGLRRAYTEKSNDLGRLGQNVD